MGDGSEGGKIPPSPTPPDKTLTVDGGTKQGNELTNCEPDLRCLNYNTVYLVIYAAILFMRIM